MLGDDPLDDLVMGDDHGVHDESDDWPVNDVLRGVRLVEYEDGQPVRMATGGYDEKMSDLHHDDSMEVDVGEVLPLPATVTDDHARGEDHGRCEVPDME